ncbi:WD repeat-containing protein 55 [Chanos chanos]|uniref:WD repeat-containing protein 55 n=1 Tax=Chanos chanos TaxID=29144 RepID=A0A6J2UPA5_CHACN|nr:WD repeat-containing protein 55 [Chanos chanos]
MAALESMPESPPEHEETLHEPKTQGTRPMPDDIRFDAIVNTVALHPKEDILAAGDIDGDIYLYSYSCNEKNRELWSSGHHLKSCRKVAFSCDGQRLFSVSKDKAIHVLDVESGRLLTRVRKAHSAAINTVLLVDENVLATGDDEGTLKVWDLRKGTSFMDVKEHEDYISDIAVDQAKRILLTSSGDGTLGVFNIKRRRFELYSEYQGGDLTSLSIMKQGQKVISGSSQGTVYIFNWNGFGAPSDRFAVQAESVDCMVPITDSLLCTASMDGVIRVINILPNRVMGSIGQHVGEPVEEIACSHDKHFLTSCAHDQLVKFWDISSLQDIQVSDYRRRKKKDSRLKSMNNKAFGAGDDFFSGLLDATDEKAEQMEEESSGDSDSD